MTTEIKWRSSILVCELAICCCTLLLGLPFYLAYQMHMSIFDENTRFTGLIATGVMSAGAWPILVIPGEIIRVVAFKRLYQGSGKVDTLFCGTLDKSQV